MNPRLLVEVGRRIDFEYEVAPTDEGDFFWLGSGPFCKIRITDASLSRRHCQFDFEDGRFYVQDLGSRNGTRVNDELIAERVQLQDGDRVTVGSSVLKVIYPAGSGGYDVNLPELGTREEEQEAYKQAAALAGTEFAGYQLETIIFNGESSVIFSARDPRHDQPVAVKVLKGLEKVTVEDQNRFIRGAKHGARLNHPNFVRVFKGGRFADWFFVAMELVHGKSLQDVIERRGGPLELNVALKIERQLLDALQHAYEHDICLRAVRPDNVIVDKGGRVKLTDYDLVKPLSGRKDAQVTRVMDGSISVDPSFAAPELIAYPVVADIKADIFGAGAILYYMLCARAPFGGLLPADKLSSAFDRKMQDPRRINPAVTDPLFEVLARAMSDYERYNTPAEMRNALDRATAES